LSHRAALEAVFAANPAIVWNRRATSFSGTTSTSLRRSAFQVIP
jgi:hypothetical protein